MIRSFAIRRTLKTAPRPRCFLHVCRSHNTLSVKSNFDDSMEQSLPNPGDDPYGVYDIC